MGEKSLELRALKIVLWIGFLLGISAGFFGILFAGFFTNLFNIPKDQIAAVSSVTTSYAALAFYLAQQKLSLPLVQLLINANWLWTMISFMATFTYGIRNFKNLENGLRETHRIIKPGGIMVILYGTQQS